MKNNIPSALQLRSLPALLGFVSILCGAASATAQTTPSLGAAQGYALLGGSTVTVAGTGTVINGHVGVAPGTSITGIPAGAMMMGTSAMHSNTAGSIAAMAAANALYVELASSGNSRMCLAIPAELGGTTKGPGSYSFGSSANIAAGTTLILDGAGVYIFKVGSAITANVGSSVVLQNGASSDQVFWQVTSAATLNGVTFSGTVVAQAAITLGVGACLQGRALTTTAGAVTLAGSNNVKSEARPAATTTIRNGSGSNDMCFFSAAPVLGSNWSSTVTHSGHLGATFTVIGMYLGGTSGIMTPGGELLLDLSSTKLLTSVLPATGVSNIHSFLVPNDATFVGLAFTAQAVIFGGGCTYCNGHDYVVGH
jgi:hypothetical protein